MSAGDAELLERWRDGDQAAGKELFGRYYYQIERFFLNKVAADVEDLVQETFLGCLRNRDRVADGGKFRSYIFSIAYNRLRSHLRKKYGRGEQVDFEDVSIVNLAPSVRAAVAHRREQRLLLEGLRSIPVDHQVILELHYWEKLTTDEIADVLGIPIGTARGRLGRARERLAKTMKQLAKSPEVLDSTLARLDEWADRCRRDLGPTADDKIN